MKRTVYILTGPAGAGKSTTAKKLIQSLERSAYLSGDQISHYPVNGRGKPWLCADTLNLTWDNILSTTKNLLRYNYDVVIDYITLPERMRWLVERLDELEARVVYVVLLVNEETLVFRDQLRAPEYRMGERSIILLREFLQSGVDSQYVIDTSSHELEQLESVVQDIRTNRRFIVK